MNLARPQVFVLSSRGTSGKQSLRLDFSLHKLWWVPFISATGDLWLWFRDLHPFSLISFFFIMPLLRPPANCASIFPFLSKGEIGFLKAALHVAFRHVITQRNLVAGSRVPCISITIRSTAATFWISDARRGPSCSHAIDSPCKSVILSHASVIYDHSRLLHRPQRVPPNVYVTDVMCGHK